MSGIKVYLHLEGEDVSYTITQYVTEDTSVADLLDSFARGLRDSYGRTYASSTLILKDEDGKTLNGTRKSLCDIVSTGDDLFVFCTAPLATAGTDRLACNAPSEAGNSTDEVSTAEDDEESEPSSPDATDAQEGTAVPSKSSKAKAKAKARARAKAKAAAATGGASKATAITTEQKASLTTFIKEKAYKKARVLAEHILSTVNIKCLFSLKALVTALYEAKHYQRAIDAGKRGLADYPRSLELNYLLAKAQVALKQYSQARTTVTTALSIYARVTGPQKEGAADEPERMKTEDFRFELLAMQAECMFEMGQHNEAVAVINSVTANTASANNVHILIAYSSFAMHYFKYEEPTRALLKAVIMGENVRVRALLARLIGLEAGMAEILRQVPPSTAPLDVGNADRRGKCEVYAFLGYVAKCHSEIAGSIRFYQLALQMLPTSTSCALSLVHMHEIAADYTNAMRVVEAFCRDNATVGLGCSGALPAPGVKPPPVGIAKLTCGEFLNVLTSTYTPLTNCGRAKRPLDFRWVQLEETYGYVEFFVPPTAVPGGEEAPTAGVKTTGTVAKKGVKYLYSDAELDLLALFATAVKIVYLQGKLHLLPGLFQVLEPCRMQTEKPLHETTIRNEMAYYGQIAQLTCYRDAHASYGLREVVPSSSSAQCVLTDFSPVLTSAATTSTTVTSFTTTTTTSTTATITPSSHTSSSGAAAAASPFASLPPLFQEACSRPIYVVGDSHTVCQSWSIVTVQGKPRLLVPRLATGVKHWHLRAESTFYPKYHFQKMIASIPPGSEVIVCLGEIDCREGILSAVERDYYTDFDEAVRSTVGFFLPVLKELVNVHRFKVYVHPIPPVLDVTRKMVIRYNHLYREAISAIKGVHWLDFFDQLLLPAADASTVLAGGGFRLDPAFVLDGTHMNPSYLRLLEGALERIVAGRS